MTELPGSTGPILLHQTSRYPAQRGVVWGRLVSPPLWTLGLILRPCLGGGGGGGGGGKMMSSVFSRTWCTPSQLSSLCQEHTQGGPSCSADSFGTALVEVSQTHSVCSSTGAVPLCAAPNVFLALFVLLCFREPAFSCCGLRC